VSPALTFVSADMRRHFKKPVVGSRHVDEDVAGADAVENRGRGELRCIDNGRRASDGAGLIERLHGAVIVAAADSREAAAAIEFLIPEGKVGETVRSLPPFTASTPVSRCMSTGVEGVHPQPRQISPLGDRG
jgi:hypothetical protein